MATAVETAAIPWWRRASLFCFWFVPCSGSAWGAEWPAGAAFAIAVMLGPETKGTVLGAELTIA
jgi:hypothetical protein